jgi:molybdopterin-guanine dinucleotide biosynthesis protein A
LAENEGLNSLIDRHDPLLVSCDAIEAQPDKAFADIDTPDDLARYGI